MKVSFGGVLPDDLFHYFIAFLRRRHTVGERSVDIPLSICLVVHVPSQYCIPICTVNASIFQLTPTHTLSSHFSNIRP
jgi:hypothetical protein